MYTIDTCTQLMYFYDNGEMSGITKSFCLSHKTVLYLTSNDTCYSSCILMNPVEDVAIG